jgi:yeast amino acid transporter
MSTDSPPENNLPEGVAAEKNLACETTEKPVDEVQDGLFIEDGLRRGLLGRHITLISLASVIGASCFYGFGYALYLSGPLGALIGFSIVGKC